MEPGLFQYSELFSELRSEGLADWANDLQHRCFNAVGPDAHGDFSKWIDAWQKLPDVQAATIDASQGRVTLTGTSEQVNNEEMRQTLMKFHPWRKGPFELFGIHIDTEWRSDWKWDRLKEHVEFRNRSVLDVGCGNGYYGWRMLEAGARRIIGLDPFLLYVMQHEVVRRYAGTAPNYVLPLGDDCLSGNYEAFDVTLSMGVLYHRTGPIDHLQTLAGTLKRGGQLVLETLIVDADHQTVLVPNGRYAKMRNVWFIPSVSMLELWLKRTGFRNITVVDVTTTSVSEQRSTEWMTFESLPDFLDPHDASRTIEGYPAPLRAILTATK